MNCVLEPIVADIIKEEVFQFRDKPQSREIVVCDVILRKDSQKQPFLLNWMRIEIGLSF